MSDQYFSNRTFCPPQIQSSPHPGLGIVVVIPCHNEAQLIASLEALYNCSTPSCAVEIIIVINAGKSASKAIHTQNRKTLDEAKTWILGHNTVEKQFHIIFQDQLPDKKAGVGLARKIGMDEAAFRLESINNPNGIVTGFDADSLCLENYFVAIEAHFKNHQNMQAASIWYEHPLSGDQFEENIYQAITEYELHLRYFTLAKRFAAYPHAFETIGSSMAVRADAYRLQGGMNIRKAGEDFYFLNKFIVLGKLNELNTTMIIPSPRVSDRVPFGTGKAVGDLLKKQGTLSSYSYESFKDLKSFIAKISEFYQSDSFDLHALPVSIQRFLTFINAEQKLIEIRNNTSDFKSFEKRFFRWFDPFLVMKYVHYARDHFYPDIPVAQAGEWILEHYYGKKEDSQNEKELLLKIRKLLKP